MSEPTEMAQNQSTNPAGESSPSGSEGAPASSESAAPPPPQPVSAAPPSGPSGSPGDGAPAVPTASDAPSLSANESSAMDAAMDASMDAAPAPRKGKRAAIRGPRKVEGGREHRKGRIVSVNATTRDVFVEFGPKELGLLEGTHFKDKEPSELPKKDESIEVVIERFDPMQSLYHCVLPGTVQKADWEMLEKGQTIEARVTGVVKGGIELEVSGHRAFMPASQVSLDHITDLSVFVGDKMVCQVDRVDKRGKGNIVLSRRNLLKEEREERAKKLRDTLEVGQTVEGTVRKIMAFGAFVDIGGVDGLVHVSDMSHDRIHASEKAIQQHVKEGDSVKVQILKLDWDEKRIALGIKQLQADPFEAAASEVVEGATLTGRVKNVADFGAFVEVAPGIEGLVHISELDWKRVNHPSDVLKPDEVVQVKVLGVDIETKKISLSIKQLKEAPKQAGGGRGGPGGRGKGRGGRQERDDRDPAEILKETPEFRRLREKAKKDSPKVDGGLKDSAGFLGEGLGNLKL